MTNQPIDQPTADGIDIFWLDAAEPEQMGGSPPGSSWSVGSMQRVGMMFPWYHSKTYFDGMQKAGATDGMMLSRSAWAGMSKHRAALWNGDTHSDFSFLSTAIQVGMGVGVGVGVCVCVWMRVWVWVWVWVWMCEWVCVCVCMCACACVLIQLIRLIQRI